MKKIKGEEEIKQSTPSIFSFLPQEIVDEILKRLPAKSLVRFTCVCKRWRSLIFSDANFSRGHIGHAKRPEWNYIITPRHRHNQDVSHHDNQQYHAILFQFINWSNLRFQDYCHSGIREPKILGQCNGLLLVGDLTKPFSNNVSKLFLWNPYINSIKRLDTPPGDSLKSDVLISGLGYDHTRDDLIAIVYFHRRTRSRGPGYMISLRRNKWLCLEEFNRTTWDGFSLVDKVATTIDGIPYWLADYEGIWKIICFDPVIAKFVQIPLPDFMQHHPQNSMPRRLGALEGLLCVVIEHRSLENPYFEVWTMKNLEKSCCWTKLYTFNRYYSTSPSRSLTLPLGYFNQGKEFIFADHTQFWSFDISHGTAKSIIFPSASFKSIIGGSVYAETLFCPWQKD